MIFENKNKTHSTGRKNGMVFAVLLICSVLLAGCTQQELPPRPEPDADKIVPEEPVLGDDCSTVSPGSRDECCARKNKDTPHIMCVGSWQYNEESGECEYVCETAEPKEAGQETTEETTEEGPEDTEESEVAEEDDAEEIDSEEVGEIELSPADDSGSTPEKVESVVEANNRFAFDLYQEYKDDAGNVFFSPYSISSALAMTFEGARGETADEMQEVFHFPEQEVRRPGFAGLYNQINLDKDYMLNTANALWLQEDFPLESDYLDTVEDYYAGEARNMDFKSDPEGSRQEINSWVEDMTYDKIQDLIPRGVITPLTRLVLTNAIYFKGDWVTQFNESLTEDADFSTPEGTVSVKMMQRTDDEAGFNYFEDELVQIIELPYSGEDLSMFILLPKENMESLEQALTIERLEDWESSMSEQRVDLFLPRFKFETKYMMVDTLKDMGMERAFVPSADFSGMADVPDLFISDVIHQAFVEVNEQGTEAAAATAVVMRVTAMPTQQTPVFRADHPFVFLIQQEETGNILFMGKVNDPAAG